MGPERRVMRLGFVRELLLTEVERGCRARDAAARVGLTKEEARVCHGLECARSEAWNEGELTERYIPGWWAGLRGVAN